MIPLRSWFFVIITGKGGVVKFFPPGDVTNISRAVERYHARHVSNITCAVEWATQCSGDDPSPSNVAYTTCVDKRNHPPVCHSDRSVSGVEESTTLEKEPTQDKTCNLGRFLDSHSLPRNDISGGGSVQPHRLYLSRCMAMNHRRYIASYHSTARVIFATSPERHTGRSLRFR